VINGGRIVGTAPAAELRRPLGAYGPLGDHQGQPNPAANCGGAISFALPGLTVGSFVNANLSIAQQAGRPR
jgi:hypothetical protein